MQVETALGNRILHELASEANTEKFQRDKQQLAGDKLNGLCISQICWMLGSHLKNGRFPDAEWVDSSHTEVAQTMQKEE
ncbi:hypothetical protein AV530_010511 [Patagioenas fasciata monilis]|uniref:Uncharacterized protein n=1 Tax=Patagioenas fasciata monilis TaxID=372326 RepID=A0A1V4KF43_PATFA|nr:hypothetical protein AV530_010511 [Patagioenas fasciata monilis]